MLVLPFIKDVEAGKRVGDDGVSEMAITDVDVRLLRGVRFSGGSGGNPPDTDERGGRGSRLIGLEESGGNIDEVPPLEDSDIDSEGERLRLGGLNVF